MLGHQSTPPPHTCVCSTQDRGWKEREGNAREKKDKRQKHQKKMQKITQRRRED